LRHRSNIIDDPVAIQAFRKLEPQQINSLSPITNEGLNGLPDFKETVDLTRERSFNNMPKSPPYPMTFISL
jgi:hypothetical protein